MDPLDHPKYTSLPPSLSMLENRFGEDVTRRLSEHYGGLPSCIPNSAWLKTHDHILVEKFGRELAMEISDFLKRIFSDYIFLIPPYKKTNAYREIYDLFMGGYTANEIAVTMGLHRTTVLRKMKMLREEGILPDNDCLHLVTANQNQQIRTLLDEGRKPGDIAKTLKLPASAVRAVRSVMIKRRTQNDTEHSKP